MIPKVIHYCWFGGGKKPVLAKKCITSWKKYCPDYKIIEWNENNFCLNKAPLYVQQAYKAKKWAFVTDYVRLYVVYSYGGIYLDTDVELIRNLDSLLSYPAYFASENDKYINTGLGFGAEKNNIVVKIMLEDYEAAMFVKENGELDLTPCPVRNTKAIKQYFKEGLKLDSIKVTEKATFFPTQYFSPLDAATRKLDIMKDTYSIHWYSASWFTENDKIYHEYRVLLNKCNNIFGEKVGTLIVRVLYFVFLPQKRKKLKKM